MGYTVVETFTDINVDGLRMVMEISDKGHVYFGSRFEVRARMLNADIAAALDFFRHYAILFSFDELKEALAAYRKYKALPEASSLSDFFRVFEEQRPVVSGGSARCVARDQ